MDNITTKNNLSPKDIKEIIRLYKKNKSILKIAKEFKSSYGTVYYYIKKNDSLKTRMKQEPNTTLLKTEEIEEYDFDDNITKFINGFFMNLFLNIKKPSRISKDTIEKKIQWYNEIIEWTKKDNLWFSMYEEYIEYNSEKLRKIIREKAKNEIKDLQTN